MNPRKIKKIAVLIPTIALAVLLVQQNYDWIFGIFIGTAVAISSCELIQKAVRNSFVRKVNRITKVFLIGFFLRYLLFAGLLYVAIVHFKVNVIAIILSFTIVQLIYPFYIVETLKRQNSNV